MNDEPVWSQWTEWSLSRPHSPRWPEPNRLYRVRNCVRPITDQNGENYHKCPGDFYEVKQNDIKVGSLNQLEKAADERAIPGDKFENLYLGTDARSNRITRNNNTYRLHDD